MNANRELRIGLLVACVLLAIVGLVGAAVVAAIDAGGSTAAAAGRLLSGAGGAMVWGLAHCDGLDGPVVALARKALETGNVNLVLPWVPPDDEAAIRIAFDRARAVRGLGAAAREVADMHFFETLVRVHRAGEGEPFTGLKPAGRDLGPAVPAADRALASGDVEELVGVVRRAIEHGIRERFARASAAKGFDPDDVAAGRAYVAAYVPFVHYVERLYADAAGAGTSHAHAIGSEAAHATPQAHGAHAGSGTHLAH